MKRGDLGLGDALLVDHQGWVGDDRLELADGAEKVLAAHLAEHDKDSERHRRVELAPYVLLGRGRLEDLALPKELAQQVDHGRLARSLRTDEVERHALVLRVLDHVGDELEQQVVRLLVPAEQHVDVLEDHEQPVPVGRVCPLLPLVRIRRPHIALVVRALTLDRVDVGAALEEGAARVVHPSFHKTARLPPDVRLDAGALLAALAGFFVLRKHDRDDLDVVVRLDEVRLTHDILLESVGAHVDEHPPRDLHVALAELGHEMVE